MKNHSLKLSAWGPYTKRFAGLSHVPDEKLGLRFDVSVFPSFYRRRVDLPNVMWESGYHVWEAASDLACFTYRHELEWKDRVYSDSTYVRLDESACLIRSHCVNNTDVGQTLALHYLASMSFPPPGPYSAETLRPMRVLLPADAQWVPALSYHELTYAKPRPTDHLMPDGLMRGEACGHGFTGVSGLGWGFGRDAGDRAGYRVALRKPISKAVAVFRFRMPQGGSVTFNLGGISAAPVTFGDTSNFSTLVHPLGDLNAGELTLTLQSLGGAAVDLDGFAICSADLVDQVMFTEHTYEPRPEIIAGPASNTVILKYPDCDRYYGLAWGQDSFIVREFHDSNLDRLMRHTAHNHVSTYFGGNQKAHYTNVFMRPLALPPQSETKVYGLACQGTLEQVRARLAKFPALLGEAESLYAAKHAAIANPEPTPAGEAYRFSQRLMAATTLTNVVYPVYTQQQYIKHYTPGRWWDCLYTWDSGFIGLGLAQHSVARAEDCLRAYLTDVGNPHAAFIHHGSMVPVQMFLFQELWNKTQSRDLLGYCYPRLKQYYEFFAGKIGGSTLANMKSGLLRPWDYFYNSGGWDDYPPQHHVHTIKQEATITPVITTAMAIRCARILKQAAHALGLAQDLASYDADIARLTAALQRHAWDEQAGYFGYVIHDDQGNAQKLLRHSSGANYNMGLDGTSPLIAGACTPQQEARLLAHLQHADQLWSRAGLSAVDLSAPYYRRDGYWNGAVWMPHQWFIWKAMLDLGQHDFAFQIARRALDLWAAETNESYHCFEHFLIENGRGAGWHQFSALSTPVMCWFAAYYRPGHLTCGLNAWVTQHAFTDHNRQLEATIQIEGANHQRGCVVVCLNPDSTYECRWNSEPVAAHTLQPGTLSVSLPAGQTTGTLTVVAVNR